MTKVSRRYARSRRTLLPKPKKGSMGTYSTKQPASKRRKVLSKRVRSKGYVTVVRELNLRSVLTKSKAPEASRKMKQDMLWIRKHRSKNM